MPPKAKANFKTYEASTRLLAALLVSIQGKVKLNFDEIAALVGGGTTYSAVEHRIRPIKQLGKMQLEYVKQNRDPAELPVDKLEIQKLYGESTPSGIEWQFREARAIGRAQQEALDNGENPAEVKLPPKGTPTRRQGPASSVSASGKATSGSKRRRVNKNPGMSNDNPGRDSKDLHSDDDDYSVEATPAPKRRNTLASNLKAIASMRSNTMSSAPTSSEKSSVNRTLFPSSTTPARPANRDSGYESPIQEPGPYQSTRASRIKAETVPAEEEQSGTRSFPRYGSSSYDGGHNDDFDDGEV